MDDEELSQVPVEPRSGACGWTWCQGTSKEHQVRWLFDVFFLGFNVFVLVCDVIFLVFDVKLLSEFDVLTV